jgi:hypothetical protein
MSQLDIDRHERQVGLDVTSALTRTAAVFATSVRSVWSDRPGCRPWPGHGAAPPGYRWVLDALSEEFILSSDGPSKSIVTRALGIAHPPRPSPSEASTPIASEGTLTISR